MRKENWMDALIAYLDDVRDKPFKWGEHDCCHFAGKCVEAMTGKNYMSDYHYDSRESAQAALKGKTLYMTIKGLLGRPVPLAQAHRGDVIYYVFKDGPCVGICIGADAVFVGAEGDRDGLVTVPVTDCSKAFHIPF